MCAEHGVLEALCTQCHPALIPVFVANGDFCEEHGFPESICPVCHPERGGRPGADVEAALAETAAPADGLEVRLWSPDIARRVGLGVHEVHAAPPHREVIASAHVAYDSARVAGVEARTDGGVDSIPVRAGDRVAIDAPLVTVASSLVAADRARVSAARTRLDVAEAAVVRHEALGTIVAHRELLSAMAERDAARSELDALDAAVRSVGRGGRGAHYVLRAPLAGVVTGVMTSIGATAAPGTVLVDVVDPSTVFLDIDLPEDDVADVRAGAPVRVTLSAPERSLETTLDYVAPEVDPHTRTVRARASLPNDDGTLRAHAFARVFVSAPRAEAAWVVPRDALQEARGVTMVFVQTAPEVFEVRHVVVVSDLSLPTVEVTGRLDATDRVVVEGAFLLRTETLGDSIGAGCCEVGDD